MRKSVTIVALGALVFSSMPALAEEGQNSAEMAAWAEMMKPTPHHENLAKMAGDWNIHSKISMDPTAPPTESDGTSHMKVVANGLFLQESVVAPMMGMPWTGFGVFGFDKGKNKHVGIWYDSAGTMIMNLEGECTDNCAQVTLTSTFIDPMSGQPATMKFVSDTVDQDNATNKMYNVVDGKDVLFGEITYSRKK